MFNIDLEVTTLNNVYKWQNEVVYRWNHYRDDCSIAVQKKIIYAYLSRSNDVY